MATPSNSPAPASAPAVTNQERWRSSVAPRTACAPRKVPIAATLTTPAVEPGACLTPGVGAGAAVDVVAATGSTLRTTGRSLSEGARGGSSSRAAATVWRGAGSPATGDG